MLAQSLMRWEAFAEEGRGGRQQKKEETGLSSGVHRDRAIIPKKPTLSLGSGKEICAS